MKIIIRFLIFLTFICQVQSAYHIFDRLYIFAACIQLRANGGSQDCGLANRYYSPRPYIDRFIEFNRQYSRNLNAANAASLENRIRNAYQLIEGNDSLYKLLNTLIMANANNGIPREWDPPSAYTKWGDLNPNGAFFERIRSLRSALGPVANDRGHVLAPITDQVAERRMEHTIGIIFDEANTDLKDKMVTYARAHVGRYKDVTGHSDGQVLRMVSSEHWQVVYLRLLNDGLDNMAGRLLTHLEHVRVVQSYITQCV